MSAPERNASTDPIPAVVLVVAVLTLLVAPLVSARYPPVLDLAQQAAQIRLFEEAWGDPASPYRVQWSSPNKLSYPILGLAMALGGAEWGPRLALFGCAALFVLGIVLLARRLKRPPEHAALAAVFVFNACLYGGFLNWIAGGIGFALWLAELGSEPPADDRRALLRLTAIGLLLYLGHLLWLAAAGLVLLLPGARRRSWRRLVLGAVALSPWLLSGGLWYLSIRDDRWQQGFHHGVDQLDRLLQWSFWPTWPLGGLKGPTEAVTLVAIAGWALFCLRRSNPSRAGRNGWLFGVAVVLALVSFLLPDGLGDTAFLSRRFVPWAAITALLALPPAGIARRFRVGFVAIVLAGFATATAVVWRQFDREEMRGFAASLAAVPDASRLLELDLHRSSPRIHGLPFFQMAAYAQLDRRVTLGYTFASTPSSLVIFREAEKQFPWSRGLEHHPELLRRQDLDQFDHLLVYGSEIPQASLRAVAGRLEPVAGELPWILYRVNPVP